MLVASLSAACFLLVQALYVKYLAKDTIDWAQSMKDAAWVFASCLLGSYAAQSLGDTTGAAPVAVFTDDPAF